MKLKRVASATAVVLAVGAFVFFCRGKRVSAEVESAGSTTVGVAASAGVFTGCGGQTSPGNQMVTARGTKPYVLTSAQPFQKPLRLAAESLGARTIGVVSAKALLIEADAATCARLAADGRFESVEEFLPSAKIAPDLAAAIRGGAEFVEAAIVTLSPADHRLVEERVVACGGEILTGCFNSGDSFRARLPAALVAELASFGDVRWMETFVRPQLMNDVAVNPKAMNVRAVWKADENPGGLSGAGQIVTTSDSGIDTGDLATIHEDLRDRICAIKVVEGCVSHDGIGHGTHTAGSIVGNGAKSDGQIRGTAWGAQLYAWFCGKDDDRSIYTPGTPGELFRPDQDNYPAFIHSASWGSSKGGQYDAQCVDIDRYVWENPDFLPVFSAGNDGENGPQTVGSPAAAKNVLAVGATQNLRSNGGGRARNGNPKVTAEYSSRGHCRDGRIKPDVAAPGTGVLSTRAAGIDYSYGNYDDYYAYDTGTSMACPLTAGAVALVREWLMRDCGFTDAEPPTAALMKAIVTGGAKDAETPNCDQGWGRVDLTESLFPSNRSVKLIDRIPFEAGKDISWIVETTNAAPFDVQLVWIDHPGVAEGKQSEARLVNDLDLSVEFQVDGDGTLLYGNGDVEPDNLNTVESVRIGDAAANRYVVTVSCRNILYDHTDGGAAALYIRGAFDPDAVREDTEIVRNRESGEFYVTLDRALEAANDGDTLEVLKRTQLKECFALDKSVAIVSTNDDPHASFVTRFNGADLTVATNATLTLSNIVFSSAAKPLVGVENGGRLVLSGLVDFGVPARFAAVRTVTTNALVLAGAIERTFTLDCAVATEVGEIFGTATCDAATAAACATKIANFSDPDRETRGGAEDSDLVLLKWGVADVPLEDSIGYFVDGTGKTNTAARLDRLIERFEAAGPNVVPEIVILSAEGLRLARPLTVRGDLTIRGETELVIEDIAGSAGFTVTDGMLSVSNLTFRGYTGNALFRVNGADAELKLGPYVAFSDIEGTNYHSGAIAVLKGSATVEGVTFDDCRATGRYAVMGTRSSYGGAIYVGGAGCLLTLDGATITDCSAANGGGGVYAYNKSAVNVEGDLIVTNNFHGTSRTAVRSDIYLAGADVRFQVTEEMTGAKRTIGVRYSGNGTDPANKDGGTFATLADGITRPAACADKFFCTADEGLEAVADGNALKWQTIPVTARGQEDDFEGAIVKVTTDDGVLYYERLEHAIAELTADATVELRADDTFAADLVITNAVVLKTDLEKVTSGIPCTVMRSADCSIIAHPGASLTITNLSVFGAAESMTGTKPLIEAKSADLTLQNGATIAHVRGAGNRKANAVTVWNDSTFRMESGAVIFDSENNYVNTPVEYSVGGGLLVDQGSAYLSGGTVNSCAAYRAGGVFIGNNSAAFVSGDFEVIGCTDLGGDASGMTVSDNSTLTMTDALVGRRIGYTEGVACDTNVFGTVAEDYAVAENLVAITNSVRCFRHDVTGAYGVAATNASDATAPMLLVWATAFDEEGRFVRREDGEDVEYRCIGAVPLHPAPVPVPLSIIYNGEEQTGVVARAGYTVGPTFAGTLVGEYTATATLEDGYHWADDFEDATRDVSWAIGKADYDMSGVSFTNATLIADGTPKSIFINGELPVGVTVSYEGNDQVQTGEYAVVAHFIGDSANYNPIEDMTATMTLVENPDPGPTPGPEPTPVPVEPIAFKSIERITDTEWRLVITNRVPYCSYRLLWTTDLTSGFVNEGDWETAAADANPEWVTNVITTGGAYFWKAEGRDGERPPEE